MSQENTNESSKKAADDTPMIVVSGNQVRMTTDPDVPLESLNKSEARAQMDEVNARGYRIGTWNGLPKYSSIFDEFETMDLAEMVEYVNNHRGGFGVYGNSARAPISQGQRFAAVSRQGAKKKA